MANVVAGAAVEAAQPASSLGIQARGLSPVPVRQGLNLTGNATSDDSWNYEDEWRLWAARGEKPWNGRGAFH